MWAWGPLEADFWRYYNIDLKEEGLSNKFTWRRFLIFVRGLPPDSAFRRWVDDKDNRKYAEWTDDSVYEEIDKVRTKRRGR